MACKEKDFIIKSLEERLIEQKERAQEQKERAEDLKELIKTKEQLIAMLFNEIDDLKNRLIDSDIGKESIAG